MSARKEVDIEMIWKAIEETGTFLFNIGTFLAGLAAFLAVLRKKPPRR